jgi:hypothetical protein
VAPQQRNEFKTWPSSVAVEHPVAFASLRQWQVLRKILRDHKAAAAYTSQSYTALLRKARRMIIDARKAASSEGLAGGGQEEPNVAIRAMCILGGSGAWLV